MRDYLINFFKEFDYPAEAREELLAAYDTIMSCDETRAMYETQLEIYQTTNGYNCGKVAEMSVLVCRACPVHEFHSQLIIHILFSRHLRELYEAKGISMEIYHNSMMDLKYKLYECKEVHGVWGSFVGSWFDGFFFLERFALGRLQFEEVPYPAHFPVYDKHGVHLDNTKTILNVHIPSGSKLPYESVIDSYKQAYEFYKQHLIDGKLVIMAESWLLYDKLPEIIGEGTNTYKFVKDYELFHSNEDPGYGDCWRLFGKYYNGNPDDLPADSGMRRRIVEWLKSGKHMGGGEGIAIFDGEKVINK